MMYELSRLIIMIALCVGICFDSNNCFNVICEKDNTNGSAIKEFQGEMNLRKNFGFCSNKNAIALTFKYCKEEQFTVTKDMLRIYYPNVRTIVWQCVGKCLIEENKKIVNLYGCEKGNLLLFIHIFSCFVCIVITRF